MIYNIVINVIIRSTFPLLGQPIFSRYRREKRQRVEMLGAGIRDAAGIEEVWFSKNNTGILVYSPPALTSWAILGKSHNASEKFPCLQNGKMTLIQELPQGQMRWCKRWSHCITGVHGGDDHDFDNNQCNN